MSSPTALRLVTTGVGRGPCSTPYPVRCRPCAQSRVPGSDSEQASVREPCATSVASWLTGTVVGWWRRAASAAELGVYGAACGGTMAASSGLDCRGCGPGVPSRERVAGVGCSGRKPSPAFLLVDMTEAS
jgi:hypothetical protein